MEWREVVGKTGVKRLPRLAMAELDVLLSDAALDRMAEGNPEQPLEILCAFLRGADRAGAAMHGGLTRKEMDNLSRKSPTFRRAYEACLEWGAIALLGESELAEIHEESNRSPRLREMRLKRLDYESRVPVGEVRDDEHGNSDMLESLKAAAPPEEQADG